jgi:hypothetical protein
MACAWLIRRQHCPDRGRHIAAANQVRVLASGGFRGSSFRSNVDSAISCLVLAAPPKKEIKTLFENENSILPG